MRVLLAPDGFGGTLSPLEAAQALARGWARGAARDRLRLVPLSDGGPGLLGVLAAARPAARQLGLTVEDPLGRPGHAWFLLDGSTAYVESALACGLHLLTPHERDPRRTTTRGVGQLVRAALDAGRGPGGRRAGRLGHRRRGRRDARRPRPAPPSTRQGRPLPVGGAALLDLHALTGEPDPRLAGTELVAASDVDAPLLGPRGATAVFGPQKGAGPDDLPVLEAAHARWADVLEAHLGTSVRDLPGAGAAGGMGAALLARRRAARVGPVAGLRPGRAGGRGRRRRPRGDR